MASIPLNLSVSTPSLGFHPVSFQQLMFTYTYVCVYALINRMIILDIK